MKLIKQIENIRDFDINDNFIGFHSLSQKISLLNIKFDVLFEEQFDEYMQEIHLVNNNFWINSSMGDKNYYFIENQLKLTPLFIYFLSEDNDNIFLFKRIKTDLSKKISKQNLLNQTKWEIEEGFICHFLKFGNFFFYARNDRRVLTCINYETGISNWEYSVSIYGWHNTDGYAMATEIEKVLGIFKEVIWILMNSGRILGLDIHNGSELHNLTFPNTYPDKYKDAISRNNYASNNAAQFDQEKGCIFGLKGEYYWEIDLGNPEHLFTYYDVEHCFKSLVVNDISIDGDEISFMHTSWPKPNITFGLFNRKHKKIVYLNEIKGNGTQMNRVDIKFSNKRLYVLDFDAVLNIYEV
jgi:hypothetical protein